MGKVDINQAHEELMTELFGKFYREKQEPLMVERTTYTRAMETVQKKYGLRQGHPDFLAWVFTCVGRSPMIIEDEGDENNEPN